MWRTISYEVRAYLRELRYIFEDICDIVKEVVIAICKRGDKYD